MDYSYGPHVATIVFSSGEGSKKYVKTEAEVTVTPFKKVSTLPC